MSEDKMPDEIYVGENSQCRYWFPSKHDDLTRSVKYIRADVKETKSLDISQEQVKKALVDIVYVHTRHKKSGSHFIISDKTYETIRKALKLAGSK